MQLNRWATKTLDYYNRHVNRSLNTILANKKIDMRSNYGNCARVPTVKQCYAKNRMHAHSI